MDKFLLIPGVLALVSGVGAYLYQQVQKWRAVSGLLEAEINLLLGEARESKAFLDGESHYWLVPGTTLKTAPKLFATSTRVFDAVLKDLYILGRTRASHVLLFYEYHGFCRRLHESLFEQVANLKTGARPLSAQDVAVLRARLARCRKAYAALDHGYTDDVGLRHLKSHYARPDAGDVLAAIAQATGPAKEP